MNETPATRIFSIHQRLINKGRPDSYSMRDVWAEIFDIPKDSPHLDDWVIEAAMAFRTEVDLASKQLAALEVPTNLTNSVFPRLRDAANPTGFNHQWMQHKATLMAPECSLVLSWSAWVLQRFGEEEIEPEQFTAIVAHLAELERLLQATEMPPALHAFVQRQVDDIRAALRMYPIQGIKALKKAVDTATGAFAAPDEAVVDGYEQAGPEAKGVFKKALEVLKQAAEATGHAEKLKNAVEAIYGSAAPHIKAIGQSVISMISGS